MHTIDTKITMQRQHLLGVESCCGGDITNGSAMATSASTATSNPLDTPEPCAAEAPRDEPAAAGAFLADLVESAEEHERAEQHDDRQVGLQLVDGLHDADGRSPWCAAPAG